MNNKLNSPKLHTQSILSFSEVIDAANNNFCLPAIQRGVVWKRDDIASFFDSLFKGIPVGSLLLWRLKDADRKIMNYYPINTTDDQGGTRRSYKIRGFENDSNNRFCVIDGQQRITALCSGLTGKYRFKDNRYQLYFNVLYDGSDKSELAFKYHSDKGLYEQNHLWIPVITIWNFFSNNSEAADESIVGFVDKWVDDTAQSDAFYRIVGGEKKKKSTVAVQTFESAYQLYNSNKNLAKQNLKTLKDRSDSGLPYHLVNLDKITTHNDNKEKLFEVFVRLNNSGKPLSPTDMLFARIAKSSADDLWEMFRNVITGINADSDVGGNKSKFTQDNLLRFIWLAERKTKESFNTFFMEYNPGLNTMQALMDRAKKAFIKAKKVYINAGFSFKGAVPYSMFLPIAYYYFYKGDNNADAKAEIERYYKIALVSEAFGRNTDMVMSEIVSAYEKNKKGYVGLFPNHVFDCSLLISTLRKNGNTFFDISSEKTTKILEMDYSKNAKTIYMVLSLLSRKKKYCLSADIVNNDVDHMHPKKYRDNKDLFLAEVNAASSLSAEEMEQLWDYYCKHVDRFANLQLLEIGVNRGDKNDKPLYKWLIESRKQNYHSYAVNNFVCKEDTPEDQPELDYFKLINFKEFYKQRYQVLLNELNKLFEVLNSNTEE